MKKIVSLIFIALLPMVLMAQSAREEIKNNVQLAGSNLLAYPTPKKQLTAAPKGYKACYISHYGRHGSRYLIDPKDYTGPLGILEKADEEGKLTALGRDVMEKIHLMDQERQGRLGELTELGAVQHRQIARRMYERFTDVFKGDTHVDAKSTTVIRCILSMENELLELATLNPRLRFTHDASKHDMYYMNFNDTTTFKSRRNEQTQNFYQNAQSRLVNPDRLIGTLFNDADYAEVNVSKQWFMERLFNLAAAVQNSEIRHQIELLSIFTDEEIYNLWQYNNIGWFQEYGPCTLNGATQPFSQRNLLKQIIHEADSCLQFDQPGATLRFGHETMVMPLTCLLNLNGYGNPLSPNQLEENGWINYRIFPMAANVQFIFYRKSPKDADVLVKILLNEEEATLPIATATAPYYKWKDVKEYYLKKIEDYENSTI